MCRLGLPADVSPSTSKTAASNARSSTEADNNCACSCRDLSFFPISNQGVGRLEDCLSDLSTHDTDTSDTDEASPRSRSEEMSQATEVFEPLARDAELHRLHRESAMLRQALLRMPNSRSVVQGAETWEPKGRRQKLPRGDCLSMIAARRENELLCADLLRRSTLASTGQSVEIEKLKEPKRRLPCGFGIAMTLATSSCATMALLRAVRASS